MQCRGLLAKNIRRSRPLWLPVLHRHITSNRIPSSSTIINQRDKIERVTFSQKSRVAFRDEQNRLLNEYISNREELLNAGHPFFESLKGIDEKTLELFGVGINTKSPESSESLVFPCYEPDFDKPIKDLEIMEFKGMGSHISLDTTGIFGLATFGSDPDTLLIVGDEISAMHAYQHTKKPVTILRWVNESTSLLPHDLARALSKFKHVYFWLGGKVPVVDYFFLKSLIPHDTFVDILPSTLRIIPPTHDLADRSLQWPAAWEDAVKLSEKVSHPHVQGAFDLYEELMHDIRNPPDKGKPSSVFKKFTEIIGGVRPGELTVFTGATGAGKTTFLSQLSIDLMQDYVPSEPTEKHDKTDIPRYGLRTLWGSFEIKRSRLLYNMLYQQCGIDTLHRSVGTGAYDLVLGTPSESIDYAKLDASAKELCKLPLYFLKYFGSEDISNILESMAFAVHAYKIEHIILDNLQFMINDAMSSGANFDKYFEMDRAIHLLRKFATTHDVHITLVIHPRKETDGDKLSLSSFYGSGKATQESDNVWIIQRDKNNQKTVDVKKNRFSGTLGSVPLIFAEPFKIFLEQDC